LLAVQAVAVTLAAVAVLAVIAQALHFLLAPHLP
jgi:hypothetical protein